MADFNIREKSTINIRTQINWIYKKELANGFQLWTDDFWYTVWWNGHMCEHIRGEISRYHKYGALNWRDNRHRKENQYWRCHYIALKGDTKNSKIYRYYEWKHWYNSWWTWHNNRTDIWSDQIDMPLIYEDFSCTKCAKNVYTLPIKSV